MAASSKPVWMRGQRSLTPYAVSAAAIIAIFFLFTHLPHAPAIPEIHPNSGAPNVSTTHETKWRFNPAKDSRNLGLSDEQCDIAFPKLYTEIDRARNHFGPRSIRHDQVSIWKADKPFKHSQVHVLIYDGQIYIVDEKEGACDRQRALAGLGNLYRAMIAMDDPTTIPNVEFILDTEDTPTKGVPEDRIVWSWSRPHTNLNTWVAPDFDGWAFPNPDLGAYISFRERIKHVEMPFEQKDPRAVWRGSQNNKVRTALMKVSEGKEWADIQTMTATTRMHMAEFCKYQFPVHTEGGTWSGRLRYLQNCNSISVVHQPLLHQAHYYDLLVADGPDQNYISVNNDFSDLHDKMEFYRANPLVAARIANNSVNTFRDRYLTPAAEACYWRRMIRSWSEVQAFTPQLYVDVEQPDGSIWKKQRGVDWEIYAAPDKNYGYKFPHWS